MKTKTITVTRTTTTLELTGQDIANLLVRSKEIGECFNVHPKDIDVKFVVPTGGDYSGVTLDVDVDAPIRVTIFRETKS